MRLVGRGVWQWSALGYWQTRNLTSSFASVSAGRTEANRVSLQYSVPSRGLGGSFEVRPPMPDGIELRLGADTRRTSGESRELASYVAGEPTAPVRCGRRELDGERIRRGQRRNRTRDLHRWRSNDHWGIADGHLFERTIVTGNVLTTSTILTQRMAADGTGRRRGQDRGVG